MNFLSVFSRRNKASVKEGEQKSLSLLDPGISEIFDVTPTYSGVNLSKEKALSVPSVLQAVRLVSETIGSLPCKLYQEEEDGKAEAKAHTAHHIVHKRANEWTGAGDLRTELTKDALLYGGGFAKVVRFEDGRPFELHRLKPGKVVVLEDTQTGAPVYRVSEASGVRDYPFTEILHINSFMSISPTASGKEAVGLSSILERHGAEFFSQGAKPSAVITNERAQGGEAGATTVSNIRKSFAAWLKNKGPLILDGGWTSSFPAMSSTDAQYLENRKFQVVEVARIFGVPPHLLFDLDRATWSNAETMGATFLQLCLRPWLDRWSEALATVLLTEDEQLTHNFEFVTDDLMRADAASRTANMTALVTSRIMTPNEVRGILNLKPLPGGDELANPNTISAALLTSATKEK
nr:phage portal protein [uncultured Cohaesibacter sp.]